MATISVASDKGGPGKTTTAILIAAELALDGYKVALLDTDATQQTAEFGKKAEIPGLTVVPDVKETTILAELRKAEAANDVVIVDLPGGASTLALKAMHRSHFVLVPMQMSLPDVMGAMSTIAQIDDAQELSGSPIARAVLWTRVSSGFESLSARHVRSSVEGTQNLQIMTTAIMERGAYKEIHLTGRVPRQTNPNSVAAQNISAVTAELLQRLAKLSEAA